jgi:hypothetical protein
MDETGYRMSIQPLAPKAPVAILQDIPRATRSFTPRGGIIGDLFTGLIEIVG